MLKEPEKVMLKDALYGAMSEIMRENPDVVWLDSDLGGAVGMLPVYEEFGERAVNCGIMEANMVGVACGLSAGGKIPFAHTFGIFMARRALDQIFMSGSYNKANVKLIGSDAGVTAEFNGGTHMPFEDIGIMRTIPEMTVLDCADPVQLNSLLKQMAELEGMVYLRMPRNNTTAVYGGGSEFVIGKGNVIKDGKDVAVIACGIEVYEALKASEALAGEGISAAVIDMFTLKPLDSELVLEYAQKTGAVVTCENANYINGLGSAVADVLCENGSVCALEKVGVRDLFGEVGNREYLMERFQLTSNDIVSACKKALRKKPGRN